MYRNVVRRRTRVTLEIVIPGYCVVGTVGHKVLAGQKKIELDKKTTIDVKLSVQQMSFSAHADAKGIMQLIRQAEPRHVVLVHGESQKMDFLRDKIKEEFSISCTKPANGETVSITTSPPVTVDMSLSLLKRSMENAMAQSSKRPKVLDKFPVRGVLVMKDTSLRLLEKEEAFKELGLVEHQLRFTSSVNLDTRQSQNDVMEQLQTLLQGSLPDRVVQRIGEGALAVDSVIVKLSAAVTEEDENCDVLVSWIYQDEDLGSKVLNLLESQKSKLPEDGELIEAESMSPGV